MKKLLATIMLAGGLATYAGAQGALIIDTTANSGDGSTTAATSGGLVWLQLGAAAAVLDTGTDISLSLLWGTSAGTVNTLADLDPNTAGNQFAWLAGNSSGATDITFFGDGTLGDPNGNTVVIPGGAIGATIWVELEGWTGSATSYPGTGLGHYAGVTAPFQVTLANPIAGGTAIPNVGAFVLTQPVPEPATMAVLGFGGLSLLLLRRRNS